MVETLLIACTILLGIVIVLQVLSMRRRPAVDLSPVEKAHERTERAVREEIGRNREEALSAGGQLRQEINSALLGVNDSLIKSVGELGKLQEGQLNVFSDRLDKLTETSDLKLSGMRQTIETRLGLIQESNSTRLDQVREQSAAAAQKAREEVNLSLKSFNDSVGKTLSELGGQQRVQLGNVVEQLSKLTESSEKKLDALKSAVEEKLKSLQEDNSRQLEQMRATVDEKLQGALEKRLGESFKQVSDRLEAVHKGLGEMQQLANGVGDVKKLLSNVKTRGTWGEVQLGALLEQVLNPNQYEKNVVVKDFAGRVEFAVKLPGRGDSADEVVWLPIDAKFPLEDYQRLIEAQERADPDAAEIAGRQLESRVKACAADICEKYINPPATTDFAILFLPTEGLFAEVLRRIGLTECIQRDSRVIIAGPTTLWSILNSLQMGFRTLAIHKRSSEVWNLLAAVKTEWTKYGDILDKVRRKLHEATNTIHEAQKRTRVIGRKLSDVQELPAGQTEAVPLLETVVESQEAKVEELF